MPLSDLSPAPRRSTTEHIAAELRTAIATGRLEPGTQLGEVELAQLFAVSRGPVREALQRLISEGLLNAVPHRGVFVSELTLQDVRDVYRTRSVLERGALETILAEGRREEAHAALAGSVDDMAAAAARGDVTGVCDADQRFHELLVDAAGSDRLNRAMRTLLAETRMCLGELETTYASPAEQAAEHATLREAILRAPADEAIALLLSHLDDAVERLTAKRGTPSG